jgi:hypothetical protein
MEALSCNHCCSGKALSITYSERVIVALGIQRAMRMRHIVICGLPRSATFCHKRHDFKKGIEYKMCFLIFSITFFFLNLSHSKKS